MYKKPKYDAYSLQTKESGQRYYIVRNAMFLNAFNDCARIISCLMGYKLMLMENAIYQAGTVRVGFPLDRLDNFKKVLEEKYPNVFVVEKNEPDIFVFAVREGMRFNVPIIEPSFACGKGGVTTDLLVEVLSIDIANITPMQAMKKLEYIKEKCKKLINA